MKQSALFSIILLVLLSAMGQLTVSTNATQGYMDTITTAPTGAILKDGKLVLAKGYKVRYSADGKIGTIYRDSDGSVTFFFKCPCYECSHFPAPDLGCMGGCCHGGVFIQIAGNPQGKSDWKMLVIPKTNTTTTSN